MCKGKFLKEKKLDIQTLLNFLLRAHTPYTITFFPKSCKNQNKSVGTWEVENGTNLVCTQILSSSVLKRIKWLLVWYPLDKLGVLVEVLLPLFSPPKFFAHPFKNPFIHPNSTHFLPIFSHPYICVYIPKNFPPIYLLPSFTHPIYVPKNFPPIYVPFFLPTHFFPNSSTHFI